MATGGGVRVLCLPWGGRLGLRLGLGLGLGLVDLARVCFRHEIIKVERKDSSSKETMEGREGEEEYDGKT